MVVLNTELEIRKLPWEATASARRTAVKTRAARRQRTVCPLRRVTCTSCKARAILIRR